MRFKATAQTFYILFASETNILIVSSKLIVEFAIKASDKKKGTAPWEINKEGHHGAIVVRYWGCNLSCALCYSQAYAYLGEDGNRKCADLNLDECEKSIKKLGVEAGWVRIQGGEPLLNLQRAIFTAKLCKFALEYLERNSPYKNPRAIIQTNGIWIGNTDEKDLTEFFKILLESLAASERGRIIIELSFKGANKDSAKKFGDTLNRHSDILSVQKNAFFSIKNKLENQVWENTDRIAFYPVGGLGPQLDNPGFIPIDIKEGIEYPLFHPLTWDENFKQVVETFVSILDDHKDVYNDYLKKHDKKIPLESMEPSFFQKGWISQISKRDVLKKFVFCNIRIKHNPRLKIFEKEISEMQIPEASDELISKIDDLKKYFYEAEPSSHYPYL